jgi:hypothetical protein
LRRLSLFAFGRHRCRSLARSCTAFRSRSMRPCAGASPAPAHDFQVDRAELSSRPLNKRPLHDARNAAGESGRCRLHVPVDRAPAYGRVCAAGPPQEKAAAGLRSATALMRYAGDQQKVTVKVRPNR